MILDYQYRRDRTFAHPGRGGKRQPAGLPAGCRLLLVSFGSETFEESPQGDLEFLRRVVGAGRDLLAHPGDEAEPEPALALGSEESQAAACVSAKGFFSGALLPPCTRTQRRAVPTRRSIPVHGTLSPA